MEFDYKLTPGIKLNKQNKLKINVDPVISIITPYYNGGKYIDETAISVLNQTFPYYEWLIVDDESTDLSSIHKLKEIEKLDSRIKILHKKNGGLADTRDYGAKNSCPSSKYFLFLDDDDLINKTYIECAYLTLETNKGASWAYTDIVNFGESELLWVKNFDSEEEKKNNLLCATALIRKDSFFKVNGYEIKEKAVFEDWNLWLKMMAKGMYPVKMSFFGFWYRKKNQNESELTRAIQNGKKSKEIINQAASKINQKIEAIQYPKQDYNWDQIEEFKNIVIPEYIANNKTKILYIMPWITVGGADKFNIDLIKGLDKDKFEITVITTEPNINPWRQSLEEITVIYDLTTFLDRKYWPSFINYIIRKNNINIIFNTNSTFGYNVLPYIKSSNPTLPIIDYIHMEEWYNRNGGFSRDSSNLSSIIDKTLVCNESSRQILINHFKRKNDEIETVYIGVNEEKFNPVLCNKDEIIQKYNIPSNKYIISFIARIDTQKRPYLLLEIIKELKNQRNDFVFLIAGDGPLLNKLKKKSDSFGLKENIIFLGSISNPISIYAISDITLNCSIKEGLALTSYESLSMGVPVISSDVGGQAELINEDVGSVVPCLQKENEILNFNYSKIEINNYVNSLNKILGNLDYYKKNSRKRILDNFTEKKMVEKMSLILEYISLNPNSIKVSNGMKLIEFKGILNELLTKYFIAHNNEYAWLCEEFKKNSFERCLNSKPISLEYVDNNSIFKKLTKLTLNLHIYNESILIFELLKQFYIMIKQLYFFLKNIAKLIFRFVLLFFIRVINLFCKIFKKEGIKYE